MLLEFTLLSAGITLISLSADKLVQKAVLLAVQMNIPNFIIGITVIAIGTSAPEIFVALKAMEKNNSAMAIGTIIGSNIANIALILGIVSTIKPLKVDNLRTKFHMLFLMIITTLIWYLLQDHNLNRIDGYILIVVTIFFIFFQIYKYIKQPNKNIQKSKKNPLLPILTWITISIILMHFSADLIVNNAEAIATYFGINPLVIGITLVSIGTSLPEIAASIAAILQKKPHLIMGNIIGSNLCNMLLVLPIPAILQPTTVPSKLFYIDLNIMWITTFLVFIFCYHQKNDFYLKRPLGVLLLLGYFLYIYNRLFFV